MMPIRRPWYLTDFVFNRCPFQSEKRDFEVMPASSAMGSSSAGHTYRVVRLYAELRCGDLAKVWRNTG